jgi:hypothetical protein
MTDQTDRMPAKCAETGHNSGVVRELPVPMHFDKIRGQVFYIIQKVRTLRMPSELYLLVRREVFHI